MRGWMLARATERAGLARTQIVAPRGEITDSLELAQRSSSLVEGRLGQADLGADPRDLAPSMRALDLLVVALALDLDQGGDAALMLGMKLAQAGDPRPRPIERARAGSQLGRRRQLVELALVLADPHLRLLTLLLELTEQLLGLAELDDPLLEPGRELVHPRAQLSLAIEVARLLEDQRAGVGPGVGQANQGRPRVEPAAIARLGSARLGPASFERTRLEPELLELAAELAGLAAQPLAARPLFAAASVELARAIEIGADPTPPLAGLLEPLLVGRQPLARAGQLLVEELELALQELQLALALPELARALIEERDPGPERGRAIDPAQQLAQLGHVGEGPLVLGQLGLRARELGAEPKPTTMPFERGQGRLALALEPTPLLVERPAPLAQPLARGVVERVNAPRTAPAGG